MRYLIECLGNHYLFYNNSNPINSLFRYRTALLDRGDLTGAAGGQEKGVRLDFAILGRIDKQFAFTELLPAVGLVEGRKILRKRAGSVRVSRGKRENERHQYTYVEHSFIF